MAGRIGEFQPAGAAGKEHDILGVGGGRDIDDAVADLAMPPPVTTAPPRMSTRLWAPTANSVPESDAARDSAAPPGSVSRVADTQTEVAPSRPASRRRRADR